MTRDRSQFLQISTFVVRFCFRYHLIVIFVLSLLAIIVLSRSSLSFQTIQDSVNYLTLRRHVNSPSSSKHVIIPTGVERGTMRENKVAIVDIDLVSTPVQVKFVQLFLHLLFPPGESCEVLECQYYAKCFQTTHGYAECRCPQCHPEKAPAREAYVCGDNDKSYLTMCVLRLESCLLQTWIQKKHDGFCGK